MKAILLAGGKGSRLRPLTLHTPKPIVPIFDRPFLQYQIDLLRQVPEIDEIVLSLNYQPRRIEEVFGDGADLGVQMTYVVEPQPLGTGGAIKFAAGDHKGDPIVVFNGDVFTSVDLPAVIALHKARKAQATIVLTPVDNPDGLWPGRDRRRGQRRAGSSRSRRPTRSPATRSTPASTCSNPTRSIGFRPTPCSRSNAATSRRSWPTRRRSSPTPTAATGSTSARPRSIARRITTSWTAASRASRFTTRLARRMVSPDAQIEDGAIIEGPCFIDAGAVIKAGARVKAHSVIGSHCHIGEGAVIDDAILWPNTWVDSEAR